MENAENPTMKISAIRVRGMVNGVPRDVRRFDFKSDQQDWRV
jgi:hypothetical protein